MTARMRSSSASMCSGGVQLMPSAVTRPLSDTIRAASSTGVPSLSRSPSRQQNVIHDSTPW